MILSPYFWLGVIVAAGGIFLSGMHLQSRLDKGELERIKREAAEQVAKVQDSQAKVTEKVVTQYRDRIKVVKEQGDVIEKQVPVYIHTGEFVPPGWRVLHDAAASGVMPASPERAIAAAEPAEAATAAQTVAANYAECRATSERLVALQNWAVYQHDATKGTP